MRLKFIIPVAVGEDGIAARADQIRKSGIAPGTSVDCFCVADNPTTVLGDYDRLLFEAYIVAVGLPSEEEGYDAVVIDTVTDSGLKELRSRLAIPVVGPGATAMHIATLLGRRFSIVTVYGNIDFVYYENVDAYGLHRQFASLRVVAAEPDRERLLAQDEQETFKRIADAAQQCVDEDGADAIILGSTTMHHAAMFIRNALSVPVIDPGPLALKMAETFVQLNLRHSKVAYPAPVAAQDDRWESFASAEGTH